MWLGNTSAVHEYIYTRLYHPNARKCNTCAIRNMHVYTLNPYMLIHICNRVSDTRALYLNSYMVPWSALHVVSTFFTCSIALDTPHANASRHTESTITR